jgi:hypothetical protein
MKMGRQRTINDAEFWRSPKIADRTQEDKATLLYSLTSPYSNIIGVYSIVPRIAAAEMGWTADQLLTVLKRLESLELLQYDAASSILWVRNWWDHNSAKMAVATTLRAKTYAQIDEIPEKWRSEFILDFLVRLPNDESNTGSSELSLRDVVAVDLESRGHTVPIPYRYPKPRVSIGYQEPMDRVAGNTTDTINVNSNNYDAELPLEFPDLEAEIQKQLAAIVGRLPQEIRQDVLDEIAAKIQAGTVRSPIKLAQHFAKNPGSFAISEGLSVRNARSQRVLVKSELQNQVQKRDSELASFDAQLGNMNEEQFEDEFGRLPPNGLQQLRNRWVRLRVGRFA